MGGHGQRRAAAAAEPAVPRRPGALAAAPSAPPAAEPRSIRWWRRAAARSVNPYTITARRGQRDLRARRAPAAGRGCRSWRRRCPPGSGSCSPRACTWAWSSTSTRPSRRQGDFLIRGIARRRPGVGGHRRGRRGRRWARPCSSTSATPARRTRISGAPWSGRSPRSDGRRAAGALLFTCNGRGSRLFAEPDHDAGLLARDARARSRWRGSSAPGNSGRSAGSNFLRAFAASIALFPGAGRPGAGAQSASPRAGHMEWPDRIDWRGIPPSRVAHRDDWCKSGIGLDAILAGLQACHTLWTPTVG